MYYKTSKVRNQKIGLYIEDGNTYMEFSADFDIVDSKGFKTKANTTIHKIDINTINMEYHWQKGSTISFPILLVKNKDNKEEFANIITEEPPIKEMSLLDIEKELGYKIKIKSL